MCWKWRRELVMQSEISRRGNALDIWDGCRVAAALGAETGPRYGSMHGANKTKRLERRFTIGRP